MDSFDPTLSLRDCPPLDEVVTHALGERISPTLVAHLTSGCKRCESLMARLQPLCAELTTGPVAPGARAHQAVLQLAAEAAAGNLNPLTVANAIEREAPVVRGAGSRDRWRFFRAEPFELDLCLREAGKLVGTVSGPDDRQADWTDAQAVLVGAMGSFEARVDEFGDFEFPELPQGPAHLGLNGAGFELLIPELKFD